MKVKTLLAAGAEPLEQTSALPVFPIAETRFGRMFTLQGDSVISRSLRVYGEFAGDEVDSILSLVRVGDHVLDLGANIGFHTLALARTVGPTGHVISVEPQHYCFQLLCANVTANQLTTVNCIRAGVGDVPGTCVVPRHDPVRRHNAGATPVSLEPGAAHPTDTVPLITVDSLALPRCDLIKIDTEGFEDRVALGARRTLATLRPALYIEIHDRDKLQRLHGLLKPLGYSLLLHRTRFFRSANAAGEPVNVFSPNTGGTALIAFPPGRSPSGPLPGETRSLG
jgi:FkbM family methyltransferase